MAEMEESPLVCVTGVSGFIASHIVQQLQQEGYRVRGTVRSLENEQKTKHLQQLCPEAKHQVELVEADLTKPESWENAIKDCMYVIHVACPNPPHNPSNEDDIVKPAVDGTTNIFKACQAAKTVKRVVFTSSVITISGEQAPDDGRLLTESDWLKLDGATGLTPYAKGKTMAEQAAWDFVKALPDDEKFELAVVNPAFVMGPILHSSPCTSMELVKRLMERAMPVIPKLCFEVCDVRDVAQAHIKAMTLSEAAGNRHIICSGNFWMKEMAQILSKEFKCQGYSVPTMNAPYIALWVNSLFDKNMKTVLPRIGKEIKYDNSKMKNVLGISPHEINNTLIDMAYSMIDGGFVKKSKKFKGPKKPGEENPDDTPKENGEAATSGEEHEEGQVNGEVGGKIEEKNKEEETNEDKKNEENQEKDKKEEKEDKQEKNESDNKKLDENEAEK